MALFGTAGIRGPVSSKLTPELALAVGIAAGREARERGDTDFVVGRDGRVTGPNLERALTSGLSAAGVDIALVGQVPTPALAFASVGRRGVMLTASHNPPADNGIKLFRDGVEYSQAAETRIEARVESPDGTARWDRWTVPRREVVLEDYRSSVTSYAEAYGHPIGGLRIAVDCGNGMASLATPAVLRALGADVTVLSGNIDGTFPARESKPTPRSLAAVRSFVRSGDWALGFGTDGDADRLVVVDADGDIVHEDTVLAILAEHFVRWSGETEPVVVTTPNASSRVDERVDAAGGRTERVALGYLHDGIESVRRGGGTVVFAGEPWKHIHPALGGWIDGVASAAIIGGLVASVGGMGQLRAPVTERPYRKESVRCPNGRKSAAMSALERDLPEQFSDATVRTDHGLRLDRPDGSWVLVRPSGTEPLIRVYAEGTDVDELVARTLETVRDCVSEAG